MKKLEVEDIVMHLGSYDSRSPMCIAAVAGNEDPEEFLVNSETEMIGCFREITSKYSLHKETLIRILYMSGSAISLPCSVSIKICELGYFRYKPEYGITFRPPVRVQEEETKAMLREVFQNADPYLAETLANVLYELICMLEKETSERT